MASTKLTARGYLALAIIIIPIILAFLFSSDSANNDYISEEEVEETRKIVVTPTPVFTLEPTTSSLNYYYTPTFRGYPCTEDCSGHEAGYEWAAEKDIDGISGCGGSSQSFIEGCESYVEEMYEEYPEDYEY